jgi:hypothetical protein
MKGISVDGLLRNDPNMSITRSRLPKAAQSKGNLEFMANRRNSNCDLPLLTDDGDIEDIIEEFPLLTDEGDIEVIIEEFPLLTDDAIAGGRLYKIT